MLPFSIFKSKPKTPHELIKQLKEAQMRLDSGTDAKILGKASHDTSKYLTALKTIVSQGEACNPASYYPQLSLL